MDSAIRCRRRGVLDGTGGGLQGHAHGEEPLDDVVVQIAGDSLSISQDGELFAVGLQPVELDGEPRLLAEALYHADLLGAEARPADQPCHAQHPVVAV